MEAIHRLHAPVPHGAVIHHLRAQAAVLLTTEVQAAVVQAEAPVAAVEDQAAVVHEPLQSVNCLFLT